MKNKIESHSTFTLQEVWSLWSKPELTQEWLELFSVAFEMEGHAVPSLNRVRLALHSIKSVPGDEVEFCIGHETYLHLCKLKARFLSGEPIQYVIGRAPFFSHLYKVNPSVLIPRPESEILVEAVSKWIMQQNAKGMFQSQGNNEILGCELGTGSGCLSIELLNRFPNLKMVGTEIDLSAIEIGIHNAQSVLGPNASLRLILMKGSSDSPMKPFDECMLNKVQRHVQSEVQLEGHSEKQSKNQSIKSRYDFFISNPPYLKFNSEAEVNVLKYEPHLALFAPEQDLLFYYRKALEWMKQSAFAPSYGFFEIPHERANEIALLATQIGLQNKISLDLTSRPRVLMAFK